ncbi:hypothetical protein GSI_04220 [Ganoderma sinense ZZ0214-1]|uniref:Uncharacterized protein n=1 Tax=Ganoderma sinense ZZ0214-1 TaxID=1077348 RepID=A0A2G8SIQ4_9APHY|nr:hypothetical protein GSI_04220 [Ganoderma sinense ZZ0214-1]
MKLSKVLHPDPGIWAFVHTLLSLSTLLVLPCVAVLFNITVDDTFGNKDGPVTPTYLPANTIKPSELDTTQILDQSWHHGSYLPGIPIYVQVTFRGTAVYVYNVVPNTLPGAKTFVNISFALDGAPVGQFLRVPDARSDILYNHLVYANTSLCGDAPHTLVFDYLLYTINVEETPSASVSATLVPEICSQTSEGCRGPGESRQKS